MDRARQASAPAAAPSDAGPAPDFGDHTTPADLVPFAELDDTTSADPPQVSVFIAWARVMRDVQAVAKAGLYNGGGTRYNFRGVDQMINAFGPACRRHGVIVTPHRITPSHAPATSKAGAAMRETTSVIIWRVYGPDGTFFEGASEGESLDSADKGAAKAQSVALRAFLIAAGLVPTDTPDPDSQHVERGERPKPKASDYVDEILNPRTSLGRLVQMKQELARHGIGGDVVALPDGGEVKVGNLLWQVGKDREDASKAAKAAIEAPADEWPAVPPIGGGE
jgi:hypothetical protein